MQIVILENSSAIADYAANIFTRQLKKQPDSTLGLATGSTPIPLYQRLIHAYQDKEISFAKVTTFNLDEYLGLAPEHLQSYRHFMKRHLFDHIDIAQSNIFVPSGNAQNAIEVCENYESTIRQRGGIDLQLLGIGRNGHIGFNEPSSGLMSRTRVKTLTEATIHDNARFFSDEEFQPHLSITMGIGTILDSRQVLLLATGGAKAKAIRAAVEGPVSASCPASALQMHPNAVVVVDAAAANELEHRAFYKHVERENQKLQQE